MIPFQIGEIRHPKVGRNRYCGPGAVSALTGCDTQQAAALMRKHSGRYSIKSSTGGEVWSALRALGYSVEDIHVKTERYTNSNGTSYNRMPSLRNWLAQSKELRGSDAFLVSTPTHWLVIQGNRRVCSLSKGIVFVDEHQPCMKQQMSGAYRITKLREVNPASVVPVRKVKPQYQIDMDRSEKKARAKAMMLAKQYKLDVEWYSYETKDAGRPWSYVGPGILHEDDLVDPYEGDHTSRNWAHALEKVETYVQLLTPKENWSRVILNQYPNKEIASWPVMNWLTR